MRKFSHNSPYLAELDLDLVGPLELYFAPSLPEPLFMDDFASDTSTTGVLTTGGFTSGTIEVENDSDWFAVTVNAGELLELAMDDIESSSVSLSLYDSTGSALVFENSVYDGFQTYQGYYSDSSQTLYVAVTGLTGVSNHTYNLEAQIYTDDYAADITTTALMVDGETFSGVLEGATDEDWVGVDLVAGEPSNFMVSGGVFEFAVSVRDAAGNIVPGVSFEPSIFDPGVTVVSFSPSVTGRYYLTVANDIEAFPNTSYSITQFTDDFSADTSTTGLVSVDGNTVAISGEHETESDVDWFSITLAENQTIEINGQYDFGISYYDADGNLVPNPRFSDDGSGFTSSITAATAGTYFVAVVSDIFVAQTYNLSGVTYVDDFLASTSTSGTLAIDGSASGILQSTTDSDWFALTLTENERVTITSDLPDEIPLQLTLRDESGNFVASESWTGVAGDFLELTYFAVNAGTYYVDVAFDYYANQAPLSYTLSATSENAEPDIAGDTSTTGVLPLGGSVSSTFDFEYDEDWFAIEVGDHQSVSFTFDGGSNTYINFRDGNGSYLGSGESYVFETAGTYFVEAGAYYDFPESSYTITATANPDDIPANTSTQATIAIGETVSSYIDDTSDADWYRMSFTEGETVRFDAIYTDGSLGYPTIYIYADNGSYVAGENGGINFTAPETGDFFIAAIGGANNGIQSYEMTAQSVVADVAGDTSTLGVITPDETIEGYIDQSIDNDWYRFSYTEGENIRFDLDVLASDYLDLYVYDNNGNRLPVYFYDNEGYFSGYSSGDYFISVEGYYDGQPKYLLTARAAEADVSSDVTTEASLIIGETALGAINSRYDRDWFRFDAELGQAIDFEVLTTEGARDLDLQIYDSSGSLVNYNSTNSLVFVAETAGTYFLEVEGNYYGFPEYEVTSSEIIDDFAANTSTTGLINGGESLSFLLEYVEDVDWFELGGTDGDVLRLSIENLSSYAEFSIVDEHGAVIIDNYYNSELGQELIDIAVSSGTNYYLRVSAYQYSYDPDTIYTITAESIDDDFIGSSQTQTFVVPGEIIAVSHDFNGDQDWFSYSATEGQSILLSYSLPAMDPNSYETLTGTVNIHNDVGDIIYTHFIGNGSSNYYPYVDAVNDFSFTFDATGTHYISSQINGLDFGQTYTFTADVITVNGTENADVLSGSEIDDVIFGGFGDDTLIGGAGDDLLNGGEGTDNLIGGLGTDILNGGGGEDAVVYSTATSGAVVDLSTGLGGAGSSAEGDSYISVENIIGSAFDDTLIGDDNRNGITGGDGDDSLSGESGSDSLYGNSGDDEIDGGVGSDYLNGGQGADMVTGGEGSDRFDYNQFGELDGDVITDFALGRDLLDFTSLIYWEGVLPIYIGNEEFTGQRGEIRFEISGNDTLIQLDSNGDGAANEYLTLLNYTDELFYVGNGDIYGVSIVNGDETDNYLYGGNLAERFYGMEGNDTIYAYGGDDVAEGGNGDDTIYGGDDNDDLAGGDGLDYVYGEAGDDVLRGDLGINYLTDTEGQNTFMLTGGLNIVVGNSQSVINFSEASSGVVADLMMAVTNSGAAEGDSYSGVDNITGSDFADRLFGDNESNILIGGDGNDALFGRNGDDIFIGGDGRDIFSGGNGFDTVDYSGEGGAVTVDMMERIVASQAAEGDRLYSIESVIGTDFNDRIFGNNDDNLIEGGEGNDSLFGRNGNDVINGGDGDDLISAGAHDDILDGGAGNDRLYTGSGSDSVVIHTANGGNDTVFDFMTGLDTILIDDVSGSFDSFAELMAAGVDNGADVTFEFGDGNSLTIKGYNLADLSASDFDFGDTPPANEFIDSEVYASDEFTSVDSFDWAIA